MVPSHMHSIAIFALTDLLPLIGPDQKVEVHGRMLNASSLRLQTFQTKGCDCVQCGAKGAFFSAECNVRVDRKTGVRHILERGYHFNLYGRRADGSVVLMTHDHIWPRSQGGHDTLKNSVTMCKKCNENKADKLPTVEQIAKWGCDYDPDFTYYPKSVRANKQPKKIRTPEEVAEKQARRHDWLSNQSLKPHYTAI